jgi:hypothetical protein
MNGATVVEAQSPGGAPTTWTVVGQRDFDGDGKVDLLWREASGATVIWFMNGTEVIKAPQQQGGGPITWNMPGAPPGWRVAGTGDFNGDGMGDILWQHTSGALAVWLLDGLGQRVINPTTTGVPEVRPPNWSIVGIADFNNDKRSDILWRDSSGNVEIWFMESQLIKAKGVVGSAPTDWTVVGTGDFNNDGKGDILWRHTTGPAAIWLMDGAQVISAAGIGGASTDWAIVSTGDYNFDRKSDILWRHTSGVVAVWFMNGVNVLSSSTIGGAANEWTIQSTNSE